MDNAVLFEDLTETTGTPISREGAEMMYTRYQLAAEWAAGRRVLELGCGSGQGFGLIASQAGRLVGGDFSLALLRSGKRHYGNRVPLLRLSADTLPFTPGSFDLVLCFESSYYVPDMARGFREMARVLAPGGILFFVNANPQRPDFIKSPHSVHYHTADEFRDVLRAQGLDVAVEGLFPVAAGRATPSFASRALSVARRLLEAIGLIPRTLRGRARLKRLVYGKLTELPAQLPPGFATSAPRFPVERGPVPGYKVLYIRATKLR